MKGVPAIPEISGEDTAWACRVLGLSPTALSGADGNDPRLAIIKSLDSLDVEACPGSGKTTLLVAKLAILARHWTERLRGICVLSHTNVARREIETRLGDTAEGKRLLSYPHFVGTIHGFVNEFLALPWLRSKRYPIRVIDDDVCLQRRWHKLPWKTRSGLENNGRDEQVLRMTATDFTVGSVPWGKGGTLSTVSETYQALQGACRESCKEGYFCHSEMFLWAAELLDRVPLVRVALRERFPLLFIDEVQDTSEQQAALLFRLFAEGEGSVIRQRFGDSNQAIYQHSSRTAETPIDPFPNVDLKRAVPNSYRFGRQIATLADPLGVSPHGLVGLGPCSEKITTETTGRHTIFLFDDQTIGRVMPSYATYLIEVFSEPDLRIGTFTAVGATHRPGEDNKVPRYVAHYWSDYDHELTASDPRPRSLLQYIGVGRALADVSGEAYYAVEKFADGVLRLAAILNPLAELSARKRRHRYVRELLADHPEADKNYVEMVSTLITAGASGFAALWDDVWVPRLKTVGIALAGTAENSAEATKFLAAGVETPAGGATSLRPPGDNVFRFPSEDPKVEVHVGSIHSIKGETHTATLVLDTFYRSHHLATLLPWLIGKKSGGASVKAILASRLKQHYVAMTRPSHLLCLAMREDCLSSRDTAALKDRGWRLARVTADGTVWF